LGLGYDAFRLLARMRGGETRLRMLQLLTVPRDRFQMAKDLELDWKTVDSHVRILLKYGMIQEKVAYGNVKLYELTVTGTLVLRLMEELGRGTPFKELETNERRIDGH